MSESIAKRLVEELRSERWPLWDSYCLPIIQAAIDEARLEEAREIRKRLMRNWELRPLEFVWISDGQILDERIAELEARRKADWSPGAVIAAYPDGTIVLDDGITTYNPERAKQFLGEARRKEQG